MAERFAVPLEPIFRANDESLELIGPQLRFPEIGS
jgi:hypothetical protein